MLVVAAGMSRATVRVLALRIKARLGINVVTDRPLLHAPPFRFSHVPPTLSQQPLTT